MMEDPEDDELLGGPSAAASPRFGELSKLTPVACAILSILALYLEFVVMHCLRLLQLELPYVARNQEEVRRAYIQLAVFHTITGLLMYCLGRCILTAPGGVPDSPAWDMRAPGDGCRWEGEAGGATGAAAKAVPLVEKKQGGERRHCKWCKIYKPDRCHHCRICNTCVLRMDHHCPWVYNCIGFRNHKYFFLLLVYTLADLLFVLVCMIESLLWATRVDVSLEVLLLVAAGEAYALFLFCLMGLFLTFHIFLMAKAMTTLEFCEKSKKMSSYNSSVYHRGLYENMCAVLGPQPLLWLVPISLPSGDGMTFVQPSEDQKQLSEDSCTGSEG